MNGFILHLQGPMMSFGDTGFGQLREAGPYPSRSAVLGILAAALGISRGDTRLLDLHRALRVHVATVRAGSLGMDYHTVKPSGYEEPDELPNRRSPADVNSVQTYRGYHHDAHFVALVGGNDGDLMAACRKALDEPVFTPFLGRRSCPPATPLRALPVSGDTIVDALGAAVVEGQALHHQARRSWRQRPERFSAYIDGEVFEAPATCRAEEVLRSYRRDLLVELPRSYVNRPVLELAVELPGVAEESATSTNEEFFHAAS